MRVALGWTVLCVALGVIGFAAHPSRAQSPQSYPYCALDSSSGATSCYYSSREQCGAKCIANPSYRGPEGAMGRPGGGRYRGRR
jgi:hypothetical protein